MSMCSSVFSSLPCSEVGAIWADSCQRMMIRTDNVSPLPVAKAVKSRYAVSCLQLSLSFAVTLKACVPNSIVQEGVGFIQPTLE